MLEDHIDTQTCAQNKVYVDCYECNGKIIEEVQDRGRRRAPRDNLEERVHRCWGDVSFLIHPLND